MMKRAETIFACIQCDSRWGAGLEVEISMCEPCFRKYRSKIEDERKFLKVECRAEREAVYSVFRRLLEHQKMLVI